MGVVNTGASIQTANIGGGTWIMEGPAFGTSGGNTSAYAAAVLADNPVHYWRLNEPVGSSVAVDSGTYGTAGNMAATSVTFGSTSLVTGDTSAFFNGSTSGLSSENSIPYILQPFSMAYVVKSNSSAANQNVFSQYDRNNNYGGPSSFYNPGGGVSANILGTAEYAQASVGGVINTTYFIGFNADISGNWVFYVNGVMTNSGTGFTGGTNVTDLITIGFTQGNSYNFSGNIGELALWNSVIPGARFAAYYAAGISGNTLAFDPSNTNALIALSSNNTIATRSSGATQNVSTVALIPRSSGKWYVEFPSSNPGSGFDFGLCLTSEVSSIINTYFGAIFGSISIDSNTGNFYNDGSSSATSLTAMSPGDSGMIAIDIATGKVWVGTVAQGWANSGNPATGANPIATITSNTSVNVGATLAISGRESGIAGNYSTIVGTVPSGFLPWAGN